MASEYVTSPWILNSLIYMIHEVTCVSVAHVTLGLCFFWFEDNALMNLAFCQFDS